MRSTTQHLIVVIGGILSLAMCHDAARGDFIADSFDTGTFYRVSSTTAAVTVLANPGITSLADIQRASDGTLYGFTAGTSPVLYRFDSTTYAATAVGNLNIGFVFEGALAFNSAGVAYGASQGNSGSPRLFTINLSTGAATVGALIGGGGHDINGMAFRSDGNLIALDDNTNSLLVINPTTGATSTLAVVGPAVGSVGGLTIVGNTGYFATAGPGGGGSNSLYSFDLFTGSQTLIGSFAPTITGIGISGLASFPSAVPEPSSLALCGIAGLAGLAYSRRRHRSIPA